ncbi:MAG: hypothetical protein LUI06_09940 [Ruminococcus sp.]|nr:hypothetical protein [Ruminococcus sp.]
MENINLKVTESLNAIKKKMDDFVSQDEAFWMSVAMFLFGVIVGMLISPRKTKIKTIKRKPRHDRYYDECDYDECYDECCDCCED